MGYKESFFTDNFLFSKDKKVMDKIIERVKELDQDFYEENGLYEYDLWKFKRDVKIGEEEFKKGQEVIFIRGSEIYRGDRNIALGYKRYNEEDDEYQFIADAKGIEETASKATLMVHKKKRSADYEKLLENKDKYVIETKLLNKDHQKLLGNLKNYLKEKENRKYSDSFLTQTIRELNDFEYRGNRNLGLICDGKSISYRGKDSFKEILESLKEKKEYYKNEFFKGLEEKTGIKINDRESLQEINQIEFELNPQKKTSYAFTDEKKYRFYEEDERKIEEAVKECNGEYRKIKETDYSRIENTEDESLENILQKRNVKYCSESYYREDVVYRKDNVNVIAVFPERLMGESENSGKSFEAVMITDKSRKVNIVISELELEIGCHSASSRDKERIKEVLEKEGTVNCEEKGSVRKDIHYRIGDGPVDMEKKGFETIYNGTDAFFFAGFKKLNNFVFKYKEDAKDYCQKNGIDEKMIRPVREDVTVMYSNDELKDISKWDRRGYRENLEDNPELFAMEAVQNYRKSIEKVMKDSKKGNEIEHILTKDLEENEKETVIRTGEKEAKRLKEEKQIKEWEIDKPTR